MRKSPKTKSCTFADFGAADGGTSNQMWDNVISKRRKAGDCRQIEMLYTDLPSNDFSSLFRMMQGMQGNSNFALQKNHDNVFVHGCGTGSINSFSLILLHLGFSATAMHYVSSKPVEIPNHVHAACADINSKTAFAKTGSS